MGMILCIETATRNCSVALGHDGAEIAIKESFDDYSHSKHLTLFVQEVISHAGITLDRLDAIAVSRGPGSFTGLRIGVSTAKGLCYALDKPLISVGTLRSMAYGMAAATKVRSMPDDTLMCPLIDARRMEVYAAIYDKQNNEMMAPVAEIMTSDSFAGYFSGHHIVFSGDGAEKCRQIYAGQDRVVFMELPVPSAAHMIIPAAKALETGVFEDLAYFEPYYLKDFVAGKPNVKGLK